MSLYVKIDNAIYNGLDFIRSRQCADGLWRDFETLAGASSDWVSGFVAHAISSITSLNEITLPTIKNLMLRQRPNGGWSYNRTVPTDCDSTAWVLLALSTAPTWKPSAIKRGIRYIELHQNKIFGGFATYSLQDEIHKFIQASEKDVNGWFNVHVCVTSVAIQSLLIHRVPIKSEIIQSASQYLIRQKNNVGLWDSYWWKGYAYSTYHVLRALSMCRVLREQEMKKTIQFLLSNQQGDGGWNDSFGKGSEVFGTAFIILSLLLYPNSETLSASKKGIYWLINQQNRDGSWPTAPILKIQKPRVMNPDTIKKWRINQLGTGVIIEDKGRVFTSSAALWALMLFRPMIDGIFQPPPKYTT
jgi:hypothetical protein